MTRPIRPEKPVPAQSLPAVDAREVSEGAWRGIAGVMLALFSVPTVLLIAILRAASPKKEPLPDSVYTTVTDKFATALERVFEPKK